LESPETPKANHGNASKDIKDEYAQNLPWMKQVE
jgi:hypothetical protein